MSGKRSNSNFYERICRPGTIMMILTHKRIWPVLVLLLADGLLFSYTDATSVPSYVVMIGFLLLAATLYQLVRGGLALTALYGLKIKRRHSLSLFMTGVIAGLIALQSVGQLSQRDFLVVLPLIILGYTYSAYARAGRRNFSS